MKIRKLLLSISALIIIAQLLPATVRAHPGDTDENGGHTVADTGEYHYHHGYPAHDHYDIDGDGVADCPYDFDDRSGQSSGHPVPKSSDDLPHISSTTSEPAIEAVDSPQQIEAKSTVRNKRKDIGEFLFSFEYLFYSFCAASIFFLYYHFSVSDWLSRRNLHFLSKASSFICILAAIPAIPFVILIPLFLFVCFLTVIAISSAFRGLQELFLRLLK